MSILFYFLATVFLFVCLFLVLLILIQKGRGGGLSSAFGGGGGNTAFGNKTGDVLTWATSIVFGVFVLLSAVLVIVGDVIADEARDGSVLSVEEELDEPITPAEPESSLPSPPTIPMDTGDDVEPAVIDEDSPANVEGPVGEEIRPAEPATQPAGE